MNIIRHVSYFLYMLGIVILHCTAFASQDTETAQSSANVEVKNIDISNKTDNGDINVYSFNLDNKVTYDIFIPLKSVNIIKDRSIELPQIDKATILSVSLITTNHKKVIQVEAQSTDNDLKLINKMYYYKHNGSYSYTEADGKEFFTLLSQHMKNVTLDVLSKESKAEDFGIGNVIDSNGTVFTGYSPHDDVFVKSVNAGDFNFFTFNESDIATVQYVRLTKSKSGNTLTRVSISLVSVTGTKIDIDFDKKHDTFVPSSESNKIIRRSATTTAETVENQISTGSVDTTNGAHVPVTKIDIRNKTPNDYITVKSFTPKEHVKYDIFISSKSIKTVMDGTKELPLKDEPKIRSVSMLTTDNNTKVIQVKSLESPYNIIYFRKLMRDSHFTDADGKQFFTLLRKYLKNVTLDISAADLPEADFGIGYGSDSDGTKSTTLCPNDDVFVESVNAGHFNFFTFNESDITTVERVKFTKRGDTLIRVSIILVSATGTRIYIDFNGKDGTFVPSSGSNKFIRTRVTTNPAVGQENTNELTGQTTPVASTAGGKSTENQSRGTETKGTPSQGTTAKTVENQMSTVPADTTDGVNVEVTKIDVSNNTGNDDITVKSFTLNDGVTYDIFIPLKSINIVMDGSIVLPQNDTARIRSVSVITTDHKKVIQVEAQPTGNDLKLINKIYYYKPNGSDSYTKADGKEFFALVRQYLRNVTLDILGKGLPEKDFIIGSGFDSSGNVFTRLYSYDDVFVISVNAGKSNLFTFDESDITTVERVKLTKSGNTLKSVSILLVSATGTRIYIDFNEKNGTFVPSSASNRFIRTIANTTAGTVENRISTVLVDTIHGPNVEVKNIDISNKTGYDNITVKSFTLNDGVTYDIFMPRPGISIGEVRDESIELPLYDTTKISSVSLITTNLKKVIQVKSSESPFYITYFRKILCSDSYTKADGKEFLILLSQHMTNVSIDVLAAELLEGGFHILGNDINTFYPNDNVFVKSVNAGDFNFFTFNESDCETVEYVHLTKSGTTLNRVSISLVSVTGRRRYSDFCREGGTFVPLSSESTRFIRGSVTHKPDIGQGNTDELTGESNFDAKPTAVTLVVALVTFVSIMYDGNTTI